MAPRLLLPFVLRGGAFGNGLMSSGVTTGGGDVKACGVSLADVEGKVGGAVGLGDDGSGAAAVAGVVDDEAACDGAVEVEATTGTSGSGRSVT